MQCLSLEDELAKRRLEKAATEGGELKVSMASILGKDPAALREERLAKLDQQIQELEHLIETGNEGLRQADAQISADITTWQESKRKNVLTACDTLCRDQIDFHRQCATIWQALISDIEDIRVP